MLITAIVLFAIAAVVGLVMAVAVFQGAPVPRTGLAAIHGLAAATALVLLLLVVMSVGGGGGLGLSLGLFVLAALGGFVLLSYHLRDRALPRALVGGHALIAVAAFLILLSAAFMTGP